jgi:hypothetical protein
VEGGGEGGGGGEGEGGGCGEGDEIGHPGTPEVQFSAPPLNELKKYFLRKV